MRISDWSSDVCSSDLRADRDRPDRRERRHRAVARMEGKAPAGAVVSGRNGDRRHRPGLLGRDNAARSEEHTSELQSLMRISYDVFCLKKKKKRNIDT